MPTIEMSEEYRHKMNGLLPMKKDVVHTFTPQSFLDYIPSEGEAFIKPTFAITQWTNEQVVLFRSMLKKELKEWKGDDGDGVVQCKYEASKPLIDGNLKYWKDMYWGDGTELESDKNINNLTACIIDDIIRELSYISGVVKRPLQKR